MKAVYVEWEDASSAFGDAWTPREDVIKRGVCKCKTIGFIIHEDKNSITVVASLHRSDVAGDMNIPKSAIRKRRVVSWKK